MISYKYTGQSGKSEPLICLLSRILKRVFVLKEQNSLVGLQILYGDQHALLMEARGGVLLWNLFTLLGLVVTWFLWQPEKREKDNMISSLSSEHEWFFKSIYNVFGKREDRRGVFKSGVVFDTKENAQTLYHGLHRVFILTRAAQHMVSASTSQCIHAQ